MWQYTVFVCFFFIAWGSSVLCLNAVISAEVFTWRSLSQENLLDAPPKDQFVNQNPMFAL